jgi:hypothetical protein
LQGIRRRLGGSASLCEPFPAKPKGLQWRTYQRLKMQAAELEGRYTVGLAGKLRRMSDDNGADLDQPGSPPAHEHR